MEIFQVTSRSDQSLVHVFHPTTAMVYLIKLNLELINETLGTILNRHDGLKTNLNSQSEEEMEPEGTHMH